MSVKKMMTVILRLALDVDSLKEVIDGGAGSGNFAHKGRQGQVGGSSPSGGGGWSASLKAKRAELSSGSDKDKAFFLYENEFMPQREAVTAWKDGSVQKHLDRYFDILEDNGDYSPRNRTVKENKVLNNKTGASVDEVMADTGVSRAEAEKYYEAIREHTNGSLLSKRFGEPLEEYIAKAPVYDGEVYRGYSLNDEDYQKLIAKKPGSKVRERSEFPTSWSHDMEVARLYSGQKEGKLNSVIIKCIKNRSGVPIEKYTHFSGENEVVMSGKARWTVLGVEHGPYSYGNRAVITVIERGE